jgi:hypothetical protein
MYEVEYSLRRPRPVGDRRKAFSIVLVENQIAESERMNALPEARVG